MNNDDVGTFVLGIFALGIFVMGFWSGLMIYKHDTFDCTNTCAGKHSIYTNNVCYCEAGE